MYPMASLVPSADSAQMKTLFIRAMKLMTQSHARCTDGAEDAGARGVMGGARWKDCPGHRAEQESH